MESRTLGDSRLVLVCSYSKERRAALERHLGSRPPSHPCDRRRQPGLCAWGCAIRARWRTTALKPWRHGGPSFIGFTWCGGRAVYTRGQGSTDVARATRHGHLRRGSLRPLPAGSAPTPPHFAGRTSGRSPPDRTRSAGPPRSNAPGALGRVREAISGRGAPRRSRRHHLGFRSSPSSPDGPRPRRERKQHDDASRRCRHEPRGRASPRVRAGRRASLAPSRARWRRRYGLPGLPVAQGPET